MNLWFRLLQVLLRDRLERRPPVSLDEEVLTPFRVWPNDLDTNLHMNNGRYLTLMDLGRLDYMARLGMLWPSARQNLWPVLGASQMIYLKPLLVWRPFAIGTRLACWDERWFVMQQRFIVGGVGGQTASKALVRGVFRRRQQTVPPAEVMRLCGQAVPARREPPPEVALWLTSLAEQRAAAQPARAASA